MGDASYGINLAHPDLKKKTLKSKLYAVVRSDFNRGYKPCIRLTGKFTED